MGEPLHTPPMTDAVTDLRRYQRHYLLRQYGDDGHVLPENLHLSKAIDRVIFAAESHDDLVATGKAILERMSATYKARNGREVGVQGDDGEMVWLVHSDEIEALRAAIKAAEPSSHG